MNSRLAIINLLLIGEADKDGPFRNIIVPASCHMWTIVKILMYEFQFRLKKSHTKSQHMVYEELFKYYNKFRSDFTSLILRLPISSSLESNI